MAETREASLVVMEKIRGKQDEGLSYDDDEKLKFEGELKKLPNVKGLRNESEGSDDGEEFGSLMFKKKYKYKSQSVDSGDKPMGFGIRVQCCKNTAVHMQRGEEDEESGLFVIRSDSQTQSGLIHTVAFEDRGDAMNFCYLLESFFEDLEDFSTNIQAVKLSSQRELKRKLKKGLQESF
ncbi:hypothetical protein Tco_0633610 [Tanacetum coccineum]